MTTKLNVKLQYAVLYVLEKPVMLLLSCVLLGRKLMLTICELVPKLKTRQTKSAADSGASGGGGSGAKKKKKKR